MLGDASLHHVEAVSYTHLDVYKRQGKDFHQHRAEEEGEDDPVVTPEGGEDTIVRHRAVLSRHQVAERAVTLAKERREEEDSHTEDCLLYTSRCV